MIATILEKIFSFLSYSKFSLILLFFFVLQFCMPVSFIANLIGNFKRGSKINPYIVPDVPEEKIDEPVVVEKRKKDVKIEEPDIIPKSIKKIAPDVKKIQPKPKNQVEPIKKEVIKDTMIKPPSKRNLSITDTGDISVKPKPKPTPIPVKPKKTELTIGDVKDIEVPKIPEKKVEPKIEIKKDPIKLPPINKRKYKNPYERWKAEKEFPLRKAAVALAESKGKTVDTEVKRMASDEWKGELFKEAREKRDIEEYGLDNKEKTTIGKRKKIEERKEPGFMGSKWKQRGGALPYNIDEIVCVFVGLVIVNFLNYFYRCSVANRSRHTTKMLISVFASSILEMLIYLLLKNKVLKKYIVGFQNDGYVILSKLFNGFILFAVFNIVTNIRTFFWNDCGDKQGGNGGDGGTEDKTCPTCEKCETCETCQECEKCEDKTCPECEKCETCETCETCKECEECEKCETCEACEDCDCEECKECETCEECEKCQECEKCEECEQCKDCEQCEDCEECEDCTGKINPDECPNEECETCETCEDCEECETCETCEDCTGKIDPDECETCETCEDCTGKINPDECPTCETCETCEDCTGKIDPEQCETCEDCTGKINPDECPTCETCETCEDCTGKIDPGECPTCETCEEVTEDTCKAKFPDNWTDNNGDDGSTNTCPDSAYSSNGKKVNICHNGNDLEISVNALDTHLGHGDTCGSCEGFTNIGFASITEGFGNILSTNNHDNIYKYKHLYRFR